MARRAFAESGMSVMVAEPLVSFLQYTILLQ